MNSGEGIIIYNHQFLKLILFISFSFSVMFSYSENLDTTRTILWEIKGDSVKSPSYIFATIRVQDRRINQFDSIAKLKISECNAFALEVIVDLVPPLQLRSLVLMQNNSIEKLLSKDDFSFVEKKYKAYTGLSLGTFSKMKPFFLYAQLMKYILPKDYKESFDTQLLAYAKRKKKRVRKRRIFRNLKKQLPRCSTGLLCNSVNLWNTRLLCLLTLRHKRPSFTAKHSAFRLF